MFKQLLLSGALATTTLAAPIDYSGVNWNDPALYAGVDWSKLDYHGEWFVLWGGSALLNQRMDPVMAPGVSTSQHAHGFAGANYVTPGMTSADLQAHNGCSTFGVKADHSVYWNPLLYFKGSDGSYTRVPEQGNRKIYYKYPTIASGDTEEFPQDFRMITGDPTCNNNECATQYNVVWHCKSNDANHANVTSTGFPQGITGCPGGWLGGGLYAEIDFPQCWNGNKFDVDNPHDHMTFASDGACPSSHPRKLPQIHGEVFFDIDQFDGQYSANDNPWTLAFGDNTGYGWHMDFMNGWVPGVLGSAMKTCKLGDYSNNEALKDPSCFGPDGIYDQTTIDSCILAPTSDEDVGWNGVRDDTSGNAKGGKLSALPGCQGFFNDGAAVTMKTCPAGSSTPTDSSPTSSVASSSPKASASHATTTTNSNLAVPAPVAALQVSSNNDDVVHVGADGVAYTG